MGRRMERVFPMVPLAKRQAVCVGIMSYDGQVNFGLIGDYDAMPDLDDLAADLEASIDELIEAAGGRQGLLRRFIPAAARRDAERLGDARAAREDSLGPLPNVAALLGERLLEPRRASPRPAVEAGAHA